MATKKNTSVIRIDDEQMAKVKERAERNDRPASRELKAIIAAGLKATECK